jgi:hypothetical protein
MYSDDEPRATPTVTATVDLCTLGLEHEDAVSATVLELFQLIRISTANPQQRFVLAPTE